MAHIGVFLRDKKAPIREDNTEIGSNPILGVFLVKKKAPARDDNQEIGLDPIFGVFWGG